MLFADYTMLTDWVLRSARMLELPDLGIDLHFSATSMTYKVHGLPV